MSSGEEEETNPPTLLKAQSPVLCGLPSLPIYSRRPTAKKISALLPVVSSSVSSSSSTSSSPLLNEFRTYLPASAEVQTSLVEKGSSEQHYRSAAIHGYAIGMLGGNVLIPNYDPTIEKPSSPAISPVYSIAPVPLSSFSMHAQCNLSEMERSSFSSADFGSGSFILAASRSKECVLLHQTSAGDFSLQSSFLDKDDDNRIFNHSRSPHCDPFSFFPSTTRRCAPSTFYDDRENACALSSGYPIDSLVQYSHLTAGDKSDSSLRLSLSRSVEEILEESESDVQACLSSPYGNGRSNLIYSHSTDNIHQSENGKLEAHTDFYLTQEDKNTHDGNLVRSVSAPFFKMPEAAHQTLSLRSPRVPSGGTALSAFLCQPSNIFWISSTTPSPRSPLGSFTVISVVSSLRNSLLSSPENISSLLRNSDEGLRGIVVGSQGSSEEALQCLLNNHHPCSDGAVDVHFGNAGILPPQKGEMCTPVALVHGRRRKHYGVHQTSDSIPIVRILSTSKLHFRVSPPAWSEVQRSGEVVDSVRSSVSDI